MTYPFNQRVHPAIQSRTGVSFGLCIRFVCGHVSVGMGAQVYKIKARGRLVGSTSFLHHIGPRDQIQGLRDGSKCLYH